MTPLKGSNLSAADAALISWWVGLPNAVRILVTIGTLVAFGWTGRGTFSEMNGIGKRVTHVEQKTGKMEAGLMYLMCSQANPGARACEYIIRDYPEYLSAIQTQTQGGAR